MMLPKLETALELMLLAPGWTVSQKKIDEGLRPRSSMKDYFDYVFEKITKPEMWQIPHNAGIDSHLDT